jgi:hypothetical protein
MQERRRGGRRMTMPRFEHDIRVLEDEALRLHSEADRVWRDEALSSDLRTAEKRVDAVIAFLKSAQEVKGKGERGKE